MKLVLQIAGGIVIGVLVLLLIFGLGAEYQAQQATKEIAAMQKQRSIKNAKRREIMNRKLEADRKKSAPVSSLQWSSRTAPDSNAEELERKKEIIDQLIKKGY